MADLTADVLIIDGPGLRAPWDAPPSSWVVAAPFVLPFSDRRLSPLLLVGWIMDPTLVLYLARYNDGDVRFDWQAIDAITRSAEEIAQQTGGEWEMTPVFIEPPKFTGGRTDEGDGPAIPQRYRALLRQRRELLGASVGNSDKKAL